MSEAREFVERKVRLKSGVIKTVRMRTLAGEDEETSSQRKAAARAEARKRESARDDRKAGSEKSEASRK